MTFLEESCKAPRKAHDELKGLGGRGRHSVVYHTIVASYKQPPKKMGELGCCSGT